MFKSLFYCVLVGVYFPIIITYGFGLKTSRSFRIDFYNHTFLKDGVPFQYVAGSIHYPRIPRIYWFDRINKAKLAGLDAIQIYVPWNFHQPEQGVFNFVGDRDLEYFLGIAADLDILVIARIGPYICGEWAFGGLPPWLLRINPSMKIRTSDADYFGAVTQWFDVLLPKIKPYLYENGGPIIMVQLENEYGSYPACDRQYMSDLFDLARSHLGKDIILFTTDGSGQEYLKCGSPDQRYLATIDFGPTNQPAPECFKSVERFRSNQPWVNSEYYTGWLDVWGSPHNRGDPDWVVNNLKNLMSYSKRVNINLYMFHGGTNFGFWNGGARPEPSITSYDYDAPVSESGDVGKKYELLQKMLFEMKGIPKPPLPKNISKKGYAEVIMQFRNHILNVGELWHEFYDPIAMEQLGHYEGFMLYKCAVHLKRNKNTTLKFTRFADNVYVYTSGNLNEYVFKGLLKFGKNTITFNTSGEKDIKELLILAENTGYINFSGNMQGDIKGLNGTVYADDTELHHWKQSVIKNPFANRYDQINSSIDWPSVGSMYSGKLYISELSELADTYIQLDSFTRGVVLINDHVVGRYDQKLGPQLRLYIPRNFLQVGWNHVAVTELIGNVTASLFVSFHTEMLWK